MTDASATRPVTALPPGLTARQPEFADAKPITELVAAYEESAKGASGADRAAIGAALTGTGSWTRRQVVVEDAEGSLVAWASVHDRAAGRTVVDVTIGPAVTDADALARALFGWAHGTAVDVARQRGVHETQLDASAYSGDARQQAWLRQAGYRHTRTWLHMTRPVSPQEGAPGALPAPRQGVTVRRVDQHDNGLPVAADLQTVHTMLEESFADHFNSYRESFPEFVQRLREDPGHRWDHWWIAIVEVDGEQVPGGALVSSVAAPDASGAAGSYIDYIGVHRRARGRGVAKALLNTVIADTARRGRNRVSLEVDADSPTGADGLYASLGWLTTYTTESWHLDVTVSAEGAGHDG